MQVALLTATPIALAATLPRCTATRGTAQLYLRMQRRPPPGPLSRLAHTPPTPATTPPRRQLREAAIAMSFPRSLDSHSAEGQKAIAAAAERNKEPILAVLKDFLGSAAPGGLFLEVASGTGQHVAHFAAGLPQLTFQPTEHEAEDGFASIRAWTSELPNVRPPLLLDASRPDGWQVAAGGCRAVFAANLTHISPWAATEGLVQGAGRVLARGGELFIYGPFSIDGKPTTESNAAFDAALRQRNLQWGYRDMADVGRLAAAAGLVLVEQRDMPANNFMLVFRKE